MQLNLPKNITTITDYEESSIDMLTHIQIAQDKFVEKNLLSQVYSTNGSFNEISDYVIEFVEAPETLYYTYIYENNEYEYSYKYTDDFLGIIITGIDTSHINDDFIFIPEKINGIDVVEIGISAFAGFSNVQSFELPSHLKVINDYAFANCSSILEIDIPSCVTDINEYAFVGCNSLTCCYLLGQRDSKKDIYSTNNTGYYGFIVTSHVADHSASCLYVNFALSNIADTAFYLINPKVFCKWFDGETIYTSIEENTNGNNTRGLYYGNYHYLIYSNIRYSNARYARCIYEIKPSDKSKINDFNNWIQSLDNNGNPSNLAYCLPLFNKQCDVRLLFAYKYQEGVVVSPHFADSATVLPFQPLKLFGRVRGMGRFAYAGVQGLGSVKIALGSNINNSAFVSDIKFYGSEFFKSNCGQFIFDFNQRNGSNINVSNFKNKFVGFCAAYWEDGHTTTADVIRFFVQYNKPLNEDGSQLADAIFYPTNFSITAWRNRNFNCTLNGLLTLDWYRDGFYISDGTRNIFCQISALGEYCFSGSTHFGGINVYSGTTNIKEFKRYAFYDCPNFATITNLSNLTELSAIGEYCFAKSSAFTYLDLSKSKIGELQPGTFQDCKSLSTIYFPDTLQNIIDDGHAFIGADNLKTIEVGNSRFSNIEFVIDNDNSSKHLHSMLILKGSDVYRPRLITYYYGYNKTSTKEKFNILLSNEETTDIENALVSSYDIGKYAFYNNQYINNLSVTCGTNILDSAFEGSSLEKILIYNQYTDDKVVLYKDCFKQCLSVKTICLSGDIYYNNENTRISSILDIFESATFKNVEFVNLANSNIKYIPRKLCYNNISLSTFELSNSNIKFIETSAFYGCSALTQINIPSHTICIERNAFASCNSLLSIIIDQYAEDSPLANQVGLWGINDNTSVFWNTKLAPPPDDPSTTIDELIIQYNSNCDPGITYTDYISNDSEDHNINKIDYTIKNYDISNFNTLRNNKHKRILHTWSSSPIDYSYYSSFKNKYLENNTNYIDDEKKEFYKSDYENIITNKLFKAGDSLSALIEQNKIVCGANKYVNIYAFWSEPYYIRYNGINNLDDVQVIGEMSAEQECAIDVTEKLTENLFACNWHTFTGWSINTDNNVNFVDKAYISNLTTTPQSTINLYTCWNNKYNIELYDNNGEFGTTLPAIYNEYIALCDVYELFNEKQPSAYWCDGWTSAINSNTILYENREDVKNAEPIDKNIARLYAKFTPIYWLSFDKGDISSVSGSMESISVKYGETYLLSANNFVNNDVVFNGWETVLSGTTHHYADKAYISNLTNVAGETIYLSAQWLPYKFIYRYDDKNKLAYLCATYGNPTSIDIPRYTIKNGLSYKVVGIDSAAFYNYNILDTSTNQPYVRCDNIQTITLPDTLSIISENVFQDLINLSNINSLSSTKISTIDNYVFYNCTSLTHIHTPSTLTDVGDYAFANCTNISSFDNISNLRNVGDNAFYNNSNLQIAKDDLSAIINIGESAFANCINLSGVNLIACKLLGNNAFDECLNITKIYIGKDVKMHNNSNNLGYAFNSQLGNTNLKTFEINEENENITIIDDNMFTNCISLSSVLLNNFTTYIGDYSFAQCSSIYSIDIPSSVSYIGDLAFNGASSLSSINVNDENDYYYDISGVLYKKIKE